jgi:hypothetical protein
MLLGLYCAASVGVTFWLDEPELVARSAHSKDWA